VLVALAAGVLASAAAAPFKGVTALQGSASLREREGAIVLGLLAVVAALASLAQRALARRELVAELRLPRRSPWIALGVVCAGLALAIAVGSRERTGQPISAGATRYTTLVSNRYAYWRVALRAFRDEPVRGVGAGGWAVYWLRYRPVLEGAQDAHSLPLQTLAELGIVGLALLLAFLAGVTLTARGARRASPALAAGPLAGVVVWVVHAPLDWDWQMPAVTLVALVLAGSLVALTEGSIGPAEVDRRSAP
jgi:O-antigen ligase